MDALFKNAAGIIREARQSLLGIVALIILAVGAVSVLFFRDEVDPSIKIVITALLMLFFGLLCLGLLLGGRSAVGNSFEGGLDRRIVVSLLTAGLGAIALTIWWGLDTHDYNRTRQGMTVDAASALSGWTTIFEEHQVLRGPSGGQLTLTPRERVPGYQVFVHIPKARVGKWEWTKDGGGNDMLVVDVRPAN
jgi:hypothetical protein